MGTYYILKYFNKKEIPGIHTDLKSGLLGSGEKSENDNLDALNGKPNGTRAPPKLEKRDVGGERKENGSAETGKSSGMDLGQGLGAVQKRANLENATDKVGDVKGQVDGVTKQLPTDGITKNLPVGGLGGLTG